MENNSNTQHNCYMIGWSIIKGVRVLTLSTLPGYAAVPNGKQYFDIIDLTVGEFLCQLRKNEVSEWFSAKAMAAGAPFNCTL